MRAESAEKNKQLIRDLFAGRTSRPAFMYRPPLIPLAEVGDYTLATEPVSKWVPWVVENYRRQAASLERHGDDSVPVARVSTGTQIFGQAFGCKVHVPPDSNPCALPMVASAAEADQLEVPDIWKTPCLYRIFELGDAVRRELGPDAALGPCDLQTGFDIANLIWDKTDLLCSLIIAWPGSTTTRLSSCSPRRPPAHASSLCTWGRRTMRWPHSGWNGAASWPHNVRPRNPRQNDPQAVRTTKTNLKETAP